MSVLPITYASIINSLHTMRDVIAGFKTNLTCSPFCITCSVGIRLSHPFCLSFKCYMGGDVQDVPACHTQKLSVTNAINAKSWPTDASSVVQDWPRVVQSCPELLSCQCLKELRENKANRANDASWAVGGWWWWWWWQWWHRQWSWYLLGWSSIFI